MRTIRVNQVQFRLKSLFGLAATLALLLATANWVLEKELPSDRSDPPPLIELWLLIPPFLGRWTVVIGFLIAPVVCIALLIRIFLLFFRSKPHAMLLIYFLGCLALGIQIESIMSPNIWRWIGAMMVASFAFIAEAFIRQLPRQQKVAAMLSAAIPPGAYLHVGSLLAIAGC